MRQLQVGREKCPANSRALVETRVYRFNKAPFAICCHAPAASTNAHFHTTNSPQLSGELEA